MYEQCSIETTDHFHSTKYFFQVVELKEHLAESQRREDILSQDIKSLTDLLKDAQNNLRISNEKIHHLSVGLIKLKNLKD